MKEKERYIIERFDEDIFDTKKDYYPSNQTICKIINQQDKRIKDLQDEQIKEMLEHQEAMELANITITNLQDRVDKLERALIDSDLELRVCYKALELANVDVAEYLEQAMEILK